MSKPIPRALFSCSNKCCREECSHYADQLYWFEAEKRWVCELCWDNLPATTDDDGSPTRGITLEEYIIGGDFKAVELLTVGLSLERKSEDQCGDFFVDWAQTPNGLCLIRMKHERTGKQCLHLHLKLNDGPWYDQPHVPAAYSQEATKDSHREFWEWAEKTLPIYNYPDVVRGHA